MALLLEGPAAAPTSAAVTVLVPELLQAPASEPVQAATVACVATTKTTDLFSTYTRVICAAVPPLAVLETGSKCGNSPLLGRGLTSLSRASPCCGCKQHMGRVAAGRMQKDSVRGYSCSQQVIHIEMQKCW